ncbi:MAG: hypothetical protein FWC51_03205 [Proteobacteria bacterium]|nr:hypothetical protein [Pseudomonadota bacterium]
MKLYLMILPLLLAACNYATIRPGTMDPGAKVFADRGGFTMRRAVKDELAGRGFDVAVGTARSSREYAADNETYDSVTNDMTAIPKDAKYIVRVQERKEIFMPYWCPFNGFWWWRFTVSIADQQTGKELLAWTSRGCANSSVRRLRDFLDQLKKK